MNKRDPFFSIIVPAYNSEKHIKRCLRSIINQSFEDWEAIVVDDGSDDGTLSILNSQIDPRIKIFSQPNKGVSAARNTGIEHAKGEYICFLDNDDEYKPNHLMIIYDFLKDKGFAECMVFTDFSENNGDSVSYVDQSFALSQKETFYNFPAVWTSSIHRSLLENIRFNESLSFYEDHEFLDRVRRHADFFHIPKDTVTRHHHKSNVTNKKFYCNKEKEKAIYYYIRTRLKFSLDGWTNLFRIYNILCLYYLRDKNYKKLFAYIIKLLISSPICLIHYPTLKKNNDETGYYDQKDYEFNRI